MTRDRIAEAALDLAGEEGFPAVTMRRLAHSMGVSVSALYKYVPDRQSVVDLAVSRFMDTMPEHRYEREQDWTESVARMYRELREAYRRHPRAALIMLDETVGPLGVPDSHITAPERMLSYLCDLGLSLPDAVAVRGQYLIDVFGFVMLIDYHNDRRGSGTPPTPAIWLDTRPHLDAPLLESGRDAFPVDPETMFQTVIDNAVTLIRAKLTVAAS